MGAIPVLTTYLIDWGWLRIGPPYIYININPVIFNIGPIALRWYGLMYAVAIVLGLRIVRGYATRKGITPAMTLRIIWWCIVAGLIGGRLYYVISAAGPGFALPRAATAHPGDVGGRHGLLWSNLFRDSHADLAGAQRVYQSPGAA